MVISIEEAKYLGDYIIEFSFSDGVKRNINFTHFLNNAKNPMIKKYLNRELFKSFIIENGDLFWNDYELCFPIWDLHEGNI